ncbi:hypothetical protein GE061_012868 [Apolygus lucorum]|uniref:Uncharacterized protein n=1 Tax=Apolygus lucorum TaxID=248454 RepID=A0A6A4JMJ4_APOLU|nr:hypothetical protein GE061_012868 [Apolygus lucorum]
MSGVSMKWFSVVFAIASLWTEVYPCLLTDDRLNSWIVTIRYAESNRVVCVGSLIAANYVVAPMTCFQKTASGGFNEGRKYTVEAGSPGECQQSRRGKLVMGHPELVEDRYKYNIAYLEVEPFDVDPVNPPVMELPHSEKNNVEMVKQVILEKAQCNLPLFKVENSRDDPKNQLTNNEVTMISRGDCWNQYCPSGNRGCLPFFWTTESYFCSTADDVLRRKCEYANIGAPVICNGTAVGFLKICREPEPLLIQGFNQEQLDGIEMYRKISSGKLEVEEDGEEQEEPPFQDGDESDEYPL